MRADIAADVAKRPYIAVGLLTWLLLLPLAATSTDAMIRRLGGRRWRRLHRLAYAAGLTAVLHYLLLVKADTLDPLAYLAVLALLLGARLPSVSARLGAGRPARLAAHGSGG